MADKKPKDEDEAQSRRFIEAATDLEAAGELNLTESEAAFERLVDNALPARKPPEK
ncbi:hypothetical protein M9M90_20695 [Phenylobacterium sp. LH3H17]|uniref:hypothetical protein n=1 Tax=Phenylobacterium sp. LH3H17 TaxID=2903901 RepID=UPI0020C97241|nr:hypothetical protein [Phenylobacterium sp. LH3H17]UTP39590.1 hypothetical protein M9M90_20695 [Phenylobacterium sp. LH3H17]